MVEQSDTEKQNDILEDSPSVGSFLWELIKVVAVALLIIIPLRLFIAEPFIVSGSSMVPNFHNKEYLIVNKIGYRFGEPQRGEVIIFKFPKDTTQFFIKRIIGLPGEQVKLQNGQVIIINTEHPNGQVLDEPYLPTGGNTFGKDGVVSLGVGEYYVLGDNRLGSSDSRVWGVLPKEDIVGEAWLRVFPLCAAGLIHPDVATAAKCNS